jgi:hypothetical protein
MPNHMKIRRLQMSTSVMNKKSSATTYRESFKLKKQVLLHLCKYQRGMGKKAKQFHKKVAHIMADKTGFTTKFKWIKSLDYIMSPIKF